MTKQMCRYWNIYIHCCPANIEIALKIPTVQGIIFVFLKQAANAVFLKGKSNNEQPKMIIYKQSRLQFHATAILHKETVSQ